MTGNHRYSLERQAGVLLEGLHAILSIQQTSAGQLTEPLGCMSLQTAFAVSHRQLNASLSMPLQGAASQQLPPPPNLSQGPQSAPSAPQGQDDIAPPPALGNPRDRRRGPSRTASEIQATANNRPGSQEQQSEQPQNQQQQPQQAAQVTYFNGVVCVPCAS